MVKYGQCRNVKSKLGGINHKTRLIRDLREKYKK